MNSSTMTTKQSSVSTAAPSVPLDCWYAMALSSQLTDKPFAISFVLGELVAVRHSDGAVHVYNAKCAHRGCSLSGGWSQNNHLVCPYHGWQYDTNGVCSHIPALRQDESIPTRARVKSYICEEKYGYLWVWIPGQSASPTYEIDPIPELDFPKMTHLPTADLSYHFHSHFSRSIENGIDPTHAPFTHGKSIGKVDPTTDLTFPKYEMNNTERSLFAQMPIKVKKLNGIAKYLMRGDQDDVYKAYRYIYPNLLMSLVNFGRFTIISLQVHVPTGEKDTNMLCTNYRNFLRKSPILTPWFNKVTISTGENIALEDDRIIKDQEPAAITYQGSNEILVESDRILIEFRRLMRQHLG